jgi:FHA domain
MANLVGRDGALRGQRFGVGSELYVGREGQQLTVEDSEMSRRHAVLRVAGGTMTVEDLGSRNGTFVNEQRIAGVTVLAPGDVVRFGTTSFTVEAAAAPPPAAAAPAPQIPEPSQPFGALAAGDVTGRPSRRVASRQLIPELLTIVAVVATAVALVAYFALR